MKRIALPFLLLWPLIGAPSPAFAQSPELMAAFNRYKALEAQGKYAEAEPFARKALEMGEAKYGPDHPEVATSLNNLAGLYVSQGHYGEAEQLYKRSIGIFEKALGRDHPDVAKLLNNLAGLYQFQGRYGKAEPLEERLRFAVAALGIGQITTIVATLSTALKQATNS